MAVDRFVEWVQTHVRRYPEMELLDVYKLLHQAAFGEGHTITNRKAAREWLEHEASLIAPDASAPLVEAVHPDGQIVRLHLRGYLAANGSLSGLLDAYIQSAEAVSDGADKARADQMGAWWDRFSELIKTDSAFARRFELRSAALIGRTRSAEHWPTTPHSPRFLAVYKPVYRLLTRAHADALLRQQTIPSDAL